MGKNKRPNLIRTYLDDDHRARASVAQLKTTCREVLWGIVQRTSIQSEFIEVEEEVIPRQMMDHMDLPLSFGQSQSSTPRKKKKKKRKRSSGASNELPRPIHNGIILESNIFLVYGHGDCECGAVCGQCCRSADGNAECAREAFVRVIGIGPSSPPGHFALVQTLNTPSIFELPRSSFHEIPPAHFMDVCTMWKDDFYYRLSLNRPDYVHEKYWDQRYRIFSRFDEGMCLDEESWYSITYEIVAEYIAKACVEAFQRGSKPLNLVLDGFSGCGGSAIQLAAHCKGSQVLAVDIDQNKLKHLQHNASVYNVSHSIDCIQSDLHTALANLGDPLRYAKILGNISKYYEANQIEVPSVLSSMPTSSASEIQPADKKALDLIVLSPPWGGPAYLDIAEYDLNTMISSGDCFQTLALAAACSSNIVLIIPRNTPDIQIKTLATLVHLSYLIDYVFVNHKLKLKAVYFGNVLTTSKHSS